MQRLQFFQCLFDIRKRPEVVLKVAGLFLARRVESIRVPRRCYFRRPLGICRLVNDGAARAVRCVPGARCPRAPCPRPAGGEGGARADERRPSTSTSALPTLPMGTARTTPGNRRTT